MTRHQLNAMKALEERNAVLEDELEAAKGRLADAEQALVEADTELALYQQLKTAMRASDVRSKVIRKLAEAIGELT